MWNYLLSCFVCVTWLSSIFVSGGSFSVFFSNPPSPHLNIESVLSLFFSLHFLLQVSPLPSYFNFCHYIYFIYEPILNSIPTSTTYEIHTAIFNWAYVRSNIFFSPKYSFFLTHIWIPLHLSRVPRSKPWGHFNSSLSCIKIFNMQIMKLG